MLLAEHKAFLEKDALSNISMVGFFSRHSPIQEMRVGDSLMLKGVSDEQWWYLSCMSSKDFELFLNQTGSGDSYIAVIDDSQLEFLRSRFAFHWILSCIRFILPNDAILPLNQMKTPELNPEDASHIYANSNYQAYSNVEYIKEQIKFGPSCGYRDDQILAGWALTHDDSAMGMLHVLEGYRRKGIARSLVINLANKIRSTGQLPFTYVEPSNTASMELVKGLGFIPDRAIHWVNLKRS